MHMTTRTLTTLFAAALGVALIAGCSDGSGTSMDGHSMASTSESPADGPADVAEADTMFATMMYPHHVQAVEMASMVAGRSTNPDVVELADEIAAAQKPEMERLASWSTMWGLPAPSTDAMSMEGMDHGSGSGMMTSQDMESLKSLSDDAFDRQWLTMMIEHHEGAVTMAEKEVAEGSYGDAVAMARTIIDTQNAEISRMRTLLG